MSRVIKFRFWSQPISHYVVPNDGILAGALKDERMTVQQFTGLLDEAGTEIYEGDIVSHRGLVSAVEFDRGAFRAMYGERREVYNLLDTDAVIVIGNICDSPELLEKQS